MNLHYLWTGRSSHFFFNFIFGVARLSRLAFLMHNKFPWAIHPFLCVFVSALSICPFSFRLRFISNRFFFFRQPEKLLKNLHTTLTAATICSSHSCLVYLRALFNPATEMPSPLERSERQKKSACRKANSNAFPPFQYSWVFCFCENVDFAPSASLISGVEFFMSLIH